MLKALTLRISSLAQRGMTAVRRAATELLGPRPGLLLGLAADLFRTRDQLLAENALLRQQLIVAQRHVKRPKIRAYERAIMVALAAVTETWQSALLLVKPDPTLKFGQLA